MARRPDDKHAMVMLSEIYGLGVGRYARRRGVFPQPARPAGGGAVRRTHRIARRSGAKRRERGLARAGNARVRNGMIQFAWRFLRFQPESELAQWFCKNTEHAGKDVRKRMIVALASQAFDRPVALLHARRSARRHHL